MAENNDQHVFFVDDELVERLMRGDKVEDSSKQKRPATVSALANAIRLATEGHLDEAVKELEAAAEKGENPVEVYTALGHLRFEQQNWNEAAECYGKVAALEPQHRTAHYNLGLCLERQGKFEEAAQSFEGALEIDPKRWQAQLVRGLCLLQLGKPQEALECLEASLKESPDHDQALFGKAVALHQLGNLDAAGEIYRKLLPSNPNSPDLLVNMIALSSTRKEEGKMREYGERLLKIRP
ncbi:MAG: tetratricopeptide repeat protein, partial [Bryobacteraceae bacterium]